MKNVFKVIATLLFTNAIVVLMLPGAVSAAALPASPALPASINGLPVIYVQTAANTAALASGQNTSSATAVKRIITLLDTSSSSAEEAVNKFSSDIGSVKALLQPGDVIEICGGPVVTKDQFLTNHAANNESWTINGSIPSYRPTANNVNPGTIVSQDQGQNYGFAYIQNNDSGIIGLAAHMAGINTPGDGNCAFMVNGMTNTNDYFIQSGVYFYGNGDANNCWATSIGGTNNDPNGPYGVVPFNLCTYTLNHDYEYDVKYLGGSGDGSCVWWMGVEDHTTGNFDSIIEYYGYGTYLDNNYDTSVFFENHNPSEDWNPGNIYIYASEARECTSSDQWVNWTSQQEALRVGSYTYSSLGVISGSLTSNNQASWYLPLVPTAQ